MSSRSKSISYPRKAVVLAAGLGTRMYPLNEECPKALMPLWGKPMLVHTLRLLKRWGVKEVAINCHHRPTDIIQALAKNVESGLKINVSFEPCILGTGGALTPLAWFLDDEPFWMINADVAADLDPLPLLKTFQSMKSFAVLWMHATKGPKTVELQESEVLNFRSSETESKKTYTFCGLQLLHRRILDFLPQTGYSSIITGYERAIKQGKGVHGVCVPDAFWADVGTPEQYIAAHKDIYKQWTKGRNGQRLFNKAYVAHMKKLQRNGTHIEGVAVLGSGTRVAKSASLKNCILWDGVYIAPKVRVQNAIIGSRSKVYNNLNYMCIRRDLVQLESTLSSVLMRMGWEPEQLTLQPLEPRGSNRTFTRISKGKQRMILVEYDNERKENALYAGHARLLARVGIRVPNVMHDEPKHQWTLYEDLGDRSLLEELTQASRARKRKLYSQILQQLCVLHHNGTQQCKRSRRTLMEPLLSKVVSI